MRPKLNFKNTGLFLGAVLLSCFAHGAVAVRAITLSAEGQGDVADLLKPTTEVPVAVTARPEAQMVKLALVFADPAEFSAVKVESCNGNFRDGIDFFFYPGWRHAFSEGGNVSVQGRVPTNEKIRTLAVGFRHNENVCIKSLKFIDAKGKVLETTLESAMLHEARKTAALVKNDDHTNDMLKAFSLSGVGRALDHELSTTEENENWLLRMRSDKTFFLRGFIDDPKLPHSFSVLGMYEILAPAAPRAKTDKPMDSPLRVKLSGVRFVTADAWDGVGDASFGYQEVKDEVVLERADSGAVMLRNKTERPNRTLPFSDLKMKPTSL